MEVDEERVSEREKDANADCIQCHIWQITVECLSCVGMCKSVFWAVAEIMQC